MAQSTAVLAVLVVEFHLDDVAHTWQPGITLSVPENGVRGEMAERVPLFCFPEGKDVLMSTEVKSESFHFSMQNASGENTFFFVHRFLKGGAQLRFPVCLVIASSFPWAPMFRQLLFTLDGVCRNTLQDVAPFLATFLQKARFAVPSPGKQLHVPACSILNSGAARPPWASAARMEPHFPSLLNSLGAERILSVVFSLLAERRVVVVSHDLDRLSNCVMAFASLLWPLQWPHFFLPILPPSLLDYTTAPMPFMVGLHAWQLTRYTQLPQEEVVFVDLDTDTALVSQHDLAVMRGLRGKKKFKALRQRLEKATASRAATQQDGLAVADAFATFMGSVLYDLREHVVRCADGTFDFRLEEFCATKARNVRALLETMLRTTMFEVFLADVERAIAAGTWESHPLAALARAHLEARRSRNVMAKVVSRVKRTMSGGSALEPDLLAGDDDDNVASPVSPVSPRSPRSPTSADDDDGFDDEAPRASTSSLEAVLHTAVSVRQSVRLGKGTFAVGTAAASASASSPVRHAASGHDRERVDIRASVSVRTFIDEATQLSEERARTHASQGLRKARHRRASRRGPPLPPPKPQFVLMLTNQPARSPLHKAMASRLSADRTPPPALRHLGFSTATSPTSPLPGEQIALTPIAESASASSRSSDPPAPSASRELDRVRQSLRSVRSSSAPADERTASERAMQRPQSIGSSRTAAKGSARK